MPPTTPVLVIHIVMITFCALRYCSEVMLIFPFLREISPSSFSFFTVRLIVLP